MVYYCKPSRDEDEKGWLVWTFFEKHRPYRFIKEIADIYDGTEWECEYYRTDADYSGLFPRDNYRSTCPDAMMCDYETMLRCLEIYGKRA